MTSKCVTTLQIWDTNYSADSVEWCPIEPYHNVFVCGTYQLIHEESEDKNCQKEQLKLGLLYLLYIDVPFSFRKLQTIELAGILDTKWCHKKVNDKILLGVVTAKGELIVYELAVNQVSENVETQFSLKLLTKINIIQEKTVLTLSLDWSFKHAQESDEGVLISVSDSLGNINLIRFDGSTAIPEIQWKLHEYEAWITAFDYWKSNIIYSGGDDMKLFILDTRAGCDNPVFLNKSHEMGVTSIHCNKSVENCLISGSYDEKLRFWDTRNMKNPQSVLPLLGGIWRLKWDPNNTQHIIAACMYGGFCIIKAENCLNPEIIAVYKEHKDIAYGADWSYHSHSDLQKILADSDYQYTSANLSLFATCSFYDHKLCVSVIDKNVK